MTLSGGYERYADEPGTVWCPRAKTDMTPCVARDGESACADDGDCVGCSKNPSNLLRDLVWEATKPVVKTTEEALLSRQLGEALNGHENPSNTPDFVLADFLRDCLAAWDKGVQARAAWYGRMDVPGRGSMPIEDVSPL